MKHKKINHILLPGLGCGSLILIITIGTVAVVILNYIRQENKANSANLAYRLEFNLNNGKFSLLLQRSLGVSICIYQEFKILKANAVRFNQFFFYTNIYSSLLYLFRLEKLKDISKSVTSDVADEYQKHETASPTQ